LRLLVKEDHRLPFVQMRALFQGGVLAEKIGNSGITQLMAKLLVKGTANRTGQQIAEQIESVGGGIDAYGGNNSFGASLEVLSGDTLLGLELMADVLLQPSFPEAALERQRVVQHAALKAQLDKLLQGTFRLMRENLFGGQGYGLDTLGTEASLDKLGAGDLAAFHQKFAVPNNAVLAIFGDVKTNDIRAEVEKAFGLWPAGNEFRAPKHIPPGEGMRRVEQVRDKEQAVAVLGYRGCSFFDEDRYALELIGEACSDLGSRLFLRIREELGLAYYVGAQSHPGFTEGHFSFYAGTSPEQLEQVEKELLAEAAKLRQDGLTDDELRRAKAKIIGQKKISRQDLGGLATMSGLDELYGLGFQSSEKDDEKYESITKAQIEAAAQKYLRPGQCVMAVTHP
jgi:zinc protease